MLAFREFPEAGLGGIRRRSRSPKILGALRRQLSGFLAGQRRNPVAQDRPAPNIKS